jgi:hypothetical protein
VLVVFYPFRAMPAVGGLGLLDQARVDIEAVLISSPRLPALRSGLIAYLFSIPQITLFDIPNQFLALFHHQFSI